MALSQTDFMEDLKKITFRWWSCLAKMAGSRLAALLMVKGKHRQAVALLDEISAEAAGFLNPDALSDSAASVLDFCWFHANSEGAFGEDWCAYVARWSAPDLGQGLHSLTAY